MGQLKAFFAFLRSISSVIDFLISLAESKKAKERQERRQQEHDKIDNDLHGYLDELGWLSDDARREDGAPIDYALPDAPDADGESDADRGRVSGEQ